MTWKEYQGIEVLDSDTDVKYRHPRVSFGNPKLTDLEGATLLALADGTYLVVCNVEGCGYNGITGKDPYVKPEGEPRGIVDQAGSLFSHINWVHRSTRFDKPAVAAAPTKIPSVRYTDAQIRVAIKIWLKWKGTNIFRWGQAACDELEGLGFKPSIAEKWNPDQLGNLVRQHSKKDKFKNIKAAPMDAEDKAALEEMVREAAERAAADGRKNTVAQNAKITSKPAHRHTPIDWDAISVDKAESQPQEEAEVTSPKPTLSFSEPEPAVINLSPKPTTKELVESLKVTPEVMVRVAPRRTGLASIAEVAEAEVVRATAPEFQRLYDLPDGSPLFIYNGVLMVGKPVRDVIL